MKDPNVGEHLASAVHIKALLFTGSAEKPCFLGSPFKCQTRQLYAIEADETRFEGSSSPIPPHKVEENVSVARTS